MTATSDLIQKLYIGYFGRAGDPSGLQYWVERSAAGMTNAQVAQSFSVQDEAKSMYGFLAAPSLGMGQDSFLESVYQNLFERSIDSTGLTYWKGQLNAGRPVGGIILDIINGAQGADATTVGNKLSVANYYTDKVISSNATWTLADDQADATSVIANVTSVSSTVSSGKALADTLVAADVAPAGHTYTITADAETVVGGMGDDAIVGSAKEIITGATKSTYTYPALPQIDQISFGGGVTLAIGDKYDVTYRGVAVTSAATTAATKADAATVVADALDLAAGFDVAKAAGDVVIVTSPVAGQSLPYFSSTSSTSYYFVEQNTSGSDATRDVIQNYSNTYTYDYTYNTYDYVGPVNDADRIDGGAGNDTMTVSSVGDVTIAGTHVVNVENLVVNASDYAGVDVSGWDNSIARVTINAPGGADLYTSSNVVAATISPSGDSAYVIDEAGTKTDPDTFATLTVTDSYNVTVESDALTTLNLNEIVHPYTWQNNIEVVAAAGTRTLTVNANDVDGWLKDAEATGLVLNTTGSAAVSLDLELAKMKALTVNASSTSSDGTTLTTDHDDYAALTTLTSTGSGALTADLTGAAKLTTIAAGSASGAQVLTVGKGLESITLGSGADKLVAAAGDLDATLTIEGGAGIDTITSVAISSAAAKVISGFEKLLIGGESLTNDLTLMTKSSISGLVIDADLAANATFTGMAGTAMTIEVDASTTHALTASLKTSTGSADKATITFADDSTGFSLNKFTSSALESIVIASNGDDTGANEVTAITDTANSLATITITGANDFKLGDVDTNTTAVAAATTNPSASVTAALTLIDGSAATGDLTISAGTRTAFTDTTIGTYYFQYGSLTIKGGAGDDDISHLASSGGTVDAGAGDDIVLLDGSSQVGYLGTGADKVTVSNAGQTIYVGVDTDVDQVIVQDDSAFTTAGAAFSSTSKVTTLYNLAIGDVIDVSDVEAATNDPVLLDVSSFMSLVDAVNGGLGTTDAITFFEWNDGNTYIVINGSVTAGEDAVLKLIGTGYDFDGTAGVITLV